MDQNSTLKSGMLVKVLQPSLDMERLGFKTGQLYEVKSGRYDQKDTLYIQRQIKENADIALGLVIGGELTELADYFAVHNCPIVLPLGNRTVS